MDSHEKLCKLICRACLKYNDGDSMASLFDNTAKNGLSTYGNDFMVLANIPLKSTDNLPSRICAKCAQYLKQLTHFKNTCKTNQKRLRALLKLSRINDGNEKKIEENLVEYLLFRHFFAKETSSCSSQQKSSTKDGTECNDLDSKCIKKFDEMDCSTMDNFDFSTENSPKNNEIVVNIERILETPTTNTESNKTSTEIRLKRYPKCTKIQKKHHNFLRKINRKYKQNLRTNDTAIDKLLDNMKDNIKIFCKSQPKDEPNLHKSHLTKPKDHICHICNKVLANPATYNQHMQLHNGCKFICEHCGKGFPSLAGLQYHQVSVHNTGPSIKCSQCNYKSFRRFDILEHERLHTGERPFTCEKCGLTFRRSFIYKKHLLVHSEKTIQCAECPKKFAQRGHMLAHFNSIHDRKYVYMCDTCGVTYAKSQTVRKHLRDRHGIPREIQGKIKKIYKEKEVVT